jgi:hypothetical protein
VEGKILFDCKDDIPKPLYLRVAAGVEGAGLESINKVEPNKVLPYRVEPY